MTNERPRLAVGGVLVERGDDGIARVLLIQRGRPPNVGRWSFPGGHVEGGERLTEAVAREVAEETGLEVEVGEMLEVVEILDPGHHFVVIDYAVRRVGGILRAGDDALAAEFVPVTDLADRGVTPALLRVVGRAMR